jgi:alginate O-acetyltransferase complex protein AlgI
VTFSSLLFLFWFLPIVLAAYHGLRWTVGWLWPRGWPMVRVIVLLAANLSFYAWGEPRYVWVMLLTSGIDWLASLLIDGLAPGAARRAVLQLAVTANLGLLAFFKYLGAADALPLGISFYTFQSMSYTFDVYRGLVPATRDPLRFACFVTLFPHFIAGPIVRYRQVKDQFDRDPVDLAGFARGVRRFVIGLGKKVLLANTLAVPADALFGLPAAELTPALAWLAVAAYGLQIYFDFSGYSDMAIGMGLMFGFTFPENFDHPYAARSLRDFWRRWHITLSSWFRDYLYVPLGGDRRGPARTAVNLVTVFALCGLWHGAAWTFLAWGLWHGAFLLLERGAFGRAVAAAPAPLAHAYTLAVVFAGWIGFRAADAAQAAGVLAAMAGATPGDPLLHPLAFHLTPQVTAALIAGAAASLPWPAPRETVLWPALRVSGVAALLAACAAALAAGTHNPFIYYRF